MIVLEGAFLENVLVHILINGGFVLEGQPFAEQFVATGENEDDERKGDNLLEGKCNADNVRVGVYHLAQCGEVERSAGVDACHHHRYGLELVRGTEIMVAENEIAGHQGYAYRKHAAQQYRQRLRQRLGP